MSFQINKRPIFSHLTDLTGPLGVEVQKSLGKSMQRSINRSKSMSESLFHNADPKYVDDVISSEQSSTLAKRNGELILEDIKREETRKLDELIQKN